MSFERVLRNIQKILLLKSYFQFICNLFKVTSARPLGNSAVLHCALLLRTSYNL
jgi:hypothetical protein